MSELHQPGMTKSHLTQTEDLTYLPNLTLPQLTQWDATSS